MISPHYNFTGHVTLLKWSVRTPTTAEALRIFSNEMAEEKLNYLHCNPLQTHWNLCKMPDDYRFSSAAFYETVTFKKQRFFVVNKFFPDRLYLFFAARQFTDSSLLMIRINAAKII